MSRCTARIAWLVLATLVGGATPGGAAQTDEAPRPVVLFFYQEGCPECVRISEVLDALGSDLPPGAVASYEITDRAAGRLFQRLQRAYGALISSVPVVFIGDRVVEGASRAQELAITDALGDCVTSPCSSPLDRLPPDVFPWVDVLQLGLLALFVGLLVLLQTP